MKFHSQIPRQSAAATLDSFCKWSSLALGLYGMKSLAEAIQYSSWREGAFALAALAQAGNHLYCRGLLKAGNFEPALTRTIVGILALFCVASLHADGNPAVAIIPLLAVGLAMPHSSSRDFKRILIAAWLLLLLNLTLWAVAPADFHGSELARTAGHVFASGAGVGVAFMLLWQFKKDLGASQEARSQASGAAQREDERYRQIVSTTQEGIWMADLEAKVLFANPRMEEILGLDPGSMLQRVIFELLPERWRALAMECQEQYRRGEAVQRDLYIQGADGQNRWLMLSGRPLHDAQGRVYGSITSVADVSELRRMQLKLNQALGVDAQGRLAGGVAHDFNNVLAVISGSTDLIGRSLKNDARAQAALDSIRDAARQATILIRRLLAFSKRNPASTGNVDLGLLTQDLLPILQRLAGSAVKVEFIPGGLPAWIRCEAGILEQILLNLVIHARADQRLDSSLVLRAEPGERLVHLKVSGLAFEMALSPGLKAVVETATKAGALVDFGAGLEGSGGQPVLQLSFPRATLSDLNEEGQPGGPRAGAILLVDDDEDVRNVALKALQLEGFEVQAASSAAQALGLFSAEPGRYGMLVTDIIMPGGFGTDLAEDLKKIKPELRVLFLSGYIGEAAFPRGGMPAGGDFLAKPFSLQELSGKVRAGLGR